MPAKKRKPVGPKSRKATRIKPKKRGFDLGVRVFRGTRGRTYLVFRTRDGAYHVFQEVEAKQAAKNCGAKPEHGPRAMWGKLWRKGQ